MSVLPGYTWIENARRGNSEYASRDYYNYRPIILLHMTVGLNLGSGYVAGHTVPPHFWINPYNGSKWQTQHPELAAKALYQPQFGYHWTNKHTYLLQTEIVGIPEVNVKTYTDAHCKWIGEESIAPQAAWLSSIGEFVDLNNVAQVHDSSGSASEHWWGRWSEQEMADFCGVGQHIRVWGNDHWDCSIEDLDRMAYYARQVFNPTKKKYRRT